MSSWFRAQPPIFTIVNIVEKGQVPMLLSIHWTKRRVNLHMRPDIDNIACEALGLIHAQAAQTTSARLAVDLASLPRVPPRLLGD